MKSRLLLFSLVSSFPISAADFQWDPNGATTGLGGAGTWNTTNVFWDAMATGINDGTDTTTATTFTTADKAIFGGTGGAVSVGTAVSLNQLSVDTTGYSFTGSKITFGGTGATLTANADFTIANAIGGNFNKTGSGAVTLTGLTTFNTVTVSAGTLTRAAAGDNDSSASIVNGGTLILANTAANGTSNVTLNSGTVRLNGTNDVQIWNGGTLTINGGTFEQNGKNETVGSLILNGGSITGAGTLTSNSVIDARSGSSSTILAGSVGLTKTTAGTVTLSAANTFTGNVLVSAGELQSSATNNVRSLGANNVGRTVTVSSGATLKFLGNDTFGNGLSTPNPALIISGTVTNAAGKFNPLGNVTLSGGLLTNVGGNGSGYEAYSLAGSVTVNGSSASSITTTGTTNTGVHLGTNTDFNVADATGSAAADLTVSAPLINRNADLGGAGGFTKSGAGTMLLSAANTFTGNVVVSAGELQTSATNNVRSLGANNIGRTVTVSSGATLKFLGNDTFGNATSTPNPALLISGTVTSVAGKFNPLANVTLSGGQLNNLGGVGSGYQAYSLAGSVTVNGTSASSITGSGSFTGVHLGTNTNFDVADATSSAASDLTVSAPLINRNIELGGAGGLTKSGAGTMTLSAINTYTGNTTVNAGTLEVSGSGQLASGTYAGNISNAGTLSINTSANQTLSGAITGAGSLIKDNTGTLTLSGNSSSFTGSTTVSAGTLLVSGQLGGNTSVSSAAILAGGGTLGGNLSFLADSLFDISSALSSNALSVAGAVTFGSGFGIDNLTGVTWGSVSNGIYTLIDTTSTDFSSAGLDHFGLVNAFELGGGRSAYFSQGSLQLVVIPEPASALLGGLGLLILLRRRRN